VNYANPENHNRQALLSYADPIVRQLWPAIATYGFLSLFPNLGLKKVFESGDYDTIVASPRGSIFQKLNEHAMELFNSDAEELAGKNSEKTDSNAGNLKLVNG